jgi:hypothetical protein
MLHPAIVFAAGIFLRKLDGAVIAKPANMFEDRESLRGKTI